MKKCLYWLLSVEVLKKAAPEAPQNNIPVRNYIDDNKTKLKQSSNMSISIMTLTEIPLSKEDCYEYRELCLSTKEGLFVNLVSSHKAEKIAR